MRSARTRSDSVSRRSAAVVRSPFPRRKLIEFDPETWAALDLLRRDSFKTFQELADEAFADLLKKHGRPTDLKTALRESARQLETSKTSRRR
jgi:hypothetical protein